MSDSCYSELQNFSNLVIDWDLGPEDAVTMYLEWGNNNWHAEHPPVRSKDDVSIYFVVDTWDESPMIRLVRRSSEQAEDLLAFPLPLELAAQFASEYGTLKGVFAPAPFIKDWIKQAMYS